MIFDATGPAPAAIAALRSHPAFPEAMRASATGIVALYQGSHLLNWLMDDRGRMLIGYLALRLHFTGQLTPTRMKALCTESAVCSPGRAGVMLNLMRFAGYLAPAPAADRRVRSLVATERLTGLLVERWRLHFVAMAPMLPDGLAALARLGDEAFVRELTLALYTRFRAGFRVLASAPDLGFFSERNAGVLILMSLMTSGEDGDPVPPSRPVPVSVSRLARRFAVSRTHVLTLLRDAAADGLIERPAGSADRVVILPRLGEAAQNAFASFYLYFADSAREALAARGDSERAA